MGKSQKKRAMRRHNPMRVPDSHLPKGLDSAAASSSKKEVILPIIQKLESVDGAERHWACVAVSNLIQNDPSTRRLLQGKNVVGALINRLTDSEEEVWIEAAGALRNLCIDGGYDICAEMYNKNILSPLQAFIPKISAALSQFIESPKTAPENARKVVYEFANNVITILWCLSETSNKALNAINQIGLVPFLMAFMACRDKLPLSTVTSAAQCLYVLSDDNRPVIEGIRSNAAYVASLMDVICTNNDTNGKDKVVDDKAVTLAVLVCGILENVSPFPSQSALSTVDLHKDVVLPVIQPVISPVSLPAISDRVRQLSMEQASEPPQIDKLSIKHAPKSDHRSPIEIELLKLENQLRTVLLSLEVLTGICAMLPETETDEADADGETGEDEGGYLSLHRLRVSWLDEDGADLDDASDEEMVVEDGFSGERPAPSQSTRILPSLVEPLLALVRPTDLSFPPAAEQSPHPPTTSALGGIHVCALECLNNIFLSLSASPHPELSADTQSGQKLWDEMWTSLNLVGTNIGRGQERKKDVWEIAIGVLWGIGNIWKGSLAPVEDQVNVLIQYCNSASDPILRVKCLGTLECLAQHPDSIDGNRAIANYLLSVLPTTTEPSSWGTEPLIQAVSALIDIFSDEDKPYDVNFRQGHFENRLSECVEGVRKTVRAIDRRKERELKVRGEEVRDNLVAFIKYRRRLKLNA
ncbi:ARM repeat-containing protein [Coniophora puteana RWD-64-598 SS2]|uniref:ARM repeat-containing protein n=1 Tax=Coniophora puteana (strain RWD-64-598) TaxID=741705 RepID=A0A5M3N783_CONPW|nr:ARM repeat-containing protein [Coniophora puteana RWD-64-598 SS2]EIW86944.1 ARM repeat-containing protein [Coniophora puteana RWD-64-598 SS2]